LREDQISISVEKEGDEKALNKVDIVPAGVQVQQAAMWRNKDTSKIKDFQQVEVISDWTFSTAYKGSLRFLSNHMENIRLSTGLEIAKPTTGSSIKIEITDIQIPYEKLGPTNPILHHGTAFLFECDLEDCGYCYG
jgi:hypothetical protein